MSTRVSRRRWGRREVEMLVMLRMLWLYMECSMDWTCYLEEQIVDGCLKEYTDGSWSGERTDERGAAIARWMGSRASKSPTAKHSRSLLSH